MTEELQNLLGEIRGIVARIRENGGADPRLLERLAELLDALLARYDLNGNGSEG